MATDATTCFFRNSANGGFICYEMRLGKEDPSPILHRRLGLTQNLSFQVITAAT